MSRHRRIITGFRRIGVIGAVPIIVAGAVVGALELDRHEHDLVVIDAGLWPQMRLAPLQTTKNAVAVISNTGGFRPRPAGSQAVPTEALPLTNDDSVAAHVLGQFAYRVRLNSFRQRADSATKALGVAVAVAAIWISATWALSWVLVGFLRDSE